MITVKYDNAGQDGLSALTSPPAGRNEHRLLGRQATISGTVALDNSYPTGGYAFNTGLKTVAGVFFEDVNGYGLYYNKTTGKLQVFSGGGTEVANATNLSTLPAVYFRAEGLW